MATTILIIGESGTGKSTSIRNLDPKETFIINVLNKALPFKGWRKNYTEASGSEGNLKTTDNPFKISKILNHVSNTRENIKTIIIDDFQYVMAHEFMRRASEKGWEKFTEIQQHAWNIIISATECRDNLNIYFLSHSETGEHGKTKCKTIGKVLDEKICLEGMFTLVLSSVIIDEKYYFQTRNDGNIMAKTPLDMFEDKYIENDLELVNKAMATHFDEDINQ
jgi:predicted AAA+ superfamily ATPase